MRTVVIHSLAALAIYEQRWNALALSAHGGFPMQGYAWVVSFLEHRLQPEQRWVCVMALQDEQLLGVAALVLSEHDGPPRPYEVLSSLRDDHTFGVSWLAAPGCEREVTALLMDTLARCRPRCRYIELLRVVREAAVQDALLPPAQPLTTCKPYGVGAYLPTVGDFQSYRAGLSRNFRNNLNKSKNKLKKLSDVRFVFAEGDEALASGLGPLMMVEASGWKGREGSAIVQSPELVRFYTSAVERLARAGWLQWHFLEADGKVLAGNLAIRFGRMILVWKLGYDESYRKCSPGGLLFERLVERAFASDEIDEVNLSTDQPWYDNWGMKKRDYVDMRLHPRRAGGLLFSYLPQQARTIVRDTPALQKLLQRLREARQTKA